MSTGSLQEYLRASPAFVMGTYGLRNVYGPMAGWPAPGDTLDNVLIWVTCLFLFTCWTKKLAIVTVGGLFFVYNYIFMIAAWCLVTDVAPGASGMFAIGAIFLSMLMWTLSSPSKFGLEYDVYKWLIVVWGVVTTGINAVWLQSMQTNKVALAPEIESYQAKMRHFEANGGEWDVGSDCPTGFKGSCAPIPSGLEETPLYPAVVIAAAAPVVYLGIALVLGVRAAADKPNAGDYRPMRV